MMEGGCPTASPTRSSRRLPQLHRTPALCPAAPPAAARVPPGRATPRATGAPTRTCRATCWQQTRWVRWAVCGWGSRSPQRSAPAKHSSSRMRHLPTSPPARVPLPLPCSCLCGQCRVPVHQPASAWPRLTLSHSLPRLLLLPLLLIARSASTCGCATARCSPAGPPCGTSSGTGSWGRPWRCSTRVGGAGRGPRIMHWGGAGAASGGGERRSLEESSATSSSGAAQPAGGPAECACIVLEAPWSPGRLLRALSPAAASAPLYACLPPTPPPPPPPPPGFGLDSFMMRYQGVDWADTKNWKCNKQCVGGG